MKPISVAKALIINEKNELLVLQIGEHTQKPERSHTPDLPGGFVEVDESEKTAVAREIEEEAGITLDESQLTLVYAGTEVFPVTSESVTKLVYLAKLDNTPEIRISWEHESFEWLPLENVTTQRIMRPFCAEAINYVTEHLV